MTASTEAGARDSEAGGPLDARWREAAMRAQRAAMPRGETVLSCSAPFGTGGLGRHLSELADALTAVGERPPVCISGDGRGPAGGASPTNETPERALGGRRGFGSLLAKLPLSPGMRTRAHMVEFDRRAARALPRAEQLIAFNGQALAQLRAARDAGYGSLGLVSANSHMLQVIERHALARSRYPLEGSWAAHMLGRNLAEYERVDQIFYASDYIRDSFLERGVAERRLVYFPLTPDPRYAPQSPQLPQSPQSPPPPAISPRRPTSNRFEIVYIGSLAVHKGVPLLIDAVRRVPDRDIALRLIGGWGSRGMRQFVQSACAQDARITVSPGDPLPDLRDASLCVHPAYEDGFGYAPAEALACGVPVLVSEDTGMKQLVDSPRRGLVLATGDLQALSEAIEAAARGELFAA